MPRQDCQHVSALWTHETGFLLVLSIQLAPSSRTPTQRWQPLRDAAVLERLAAIAQMEDRPIAARAARVTLRYTEFPNNAAVAREFDLSYSYVRSLTTKVALHGPDWLLTRRDTNRSPWRRKSSHVDASGTNRTGPEGSNPHPDGNQNPELSR